ncbi:MAG TPA: TetR/AcrR family transcriptional regulator [Ktedonobacterales bacterium]|nr:TetR/AcrR family transcriptional regulator [Ktedonobacterales bacterium]
MARKPAIPGVDRRQQILEAALAVFAEQGFDGATTKDIAARAEVTHGLIYFYFDSKEDLFLAAFEHEAEGVFAQVNLADEVDDDAPVDATLTFMLTRILQVLSSPQAQHMLQVMMHLAAHQERAGGPLRECKVAMAARAARLTDQLRQYLDRQVAMGRLRVVDTQMVATLLLGSAMTLYRIKRYGVADKYEGFMASVTRAERDESAPPVDCGGIAAKIANTFLHGVLA